MACRGLGSWQVRVSQGCVSDKQMAPASGRELREVKLLQKGCSQNQNGTEPELNRNKCWVRHILTLAVPRTDRPGMKHNSSGKKTKEPWKAGERADGNQAGETMMAESVCLPFFIKVQTETLFYWCGT